MKIRLLFCCLLGLLLNLASEEKFISFDQAVRLENGREHSQLTAENGTLPVVFFPNSNLCQVTFPKAVQVPACSQIRIRIRLQCEPGCPINTFSARFMDRDDEVFQYSLPTDLRAGGIFELEKSFQVEKFGSCWSGKIKNQQPDFPLRFMAVMASAAKVDGAPRYTLLSASVEADPQNAEEKKALVRRSLWTFDDFNQFAIQNGTFLVEKTGVHISVRKAQTIFLDRNDQNYPLHPGLTAMEVTTSQTTGKITLGLRFSDKHNKFFDSPQIPLPAEGGKIRVPVDLSKGIPPYVFQGFRFALADDATGELTISRVETLTEQDFLEAVDFDIETGTAPRVLRKGAQDNLQISFNNNAPRAGDFAFDLQFTHNSGLAFREKVSAKINSGETFRFTPKWHPNLLGHWTVNATISEAKVPSTRVVQRSFAYLIPAGPRMDRSGKGFLFGMCAGSVRYSTAEAEKEAETAWLCGVQIMRDNSCWYHIQPEPNEWRWEFSDERLERFQKRGIELQQILGFAPRWAVQDPFRQSSNYMIWSRGVPEYDKWRIYVREISRRYKGKIRFWEIWNEPDLISFFRGTPEQFAELQKIAWDELKKTDPSNRVMSGGFATLADMPAFRRTDPYFYRHALEKTKGFFDIHANHDHGSFNIYVDVMEKRFFPTRRELGVSEPWYATETADPSYQGPPGEYKQALQLFKKLIYSWAHGAIAYNWYNLRNNGFDHQDLEHNFGMITFDFYPKMIYPVYNQLAATYTGAKFVRQLSADDLWAFEFRKGDNTLLAYWGKDEFNKSSNSYLLQSNGTSAVHIDMMENRTPLEFKNSLLLLQGSAEPGTIELSSSSKMEFFGRLFDTPSVAGIFPGKENELHFHLLNPSDQALIFQIEQLNLPDKITGSLVLNDNLPLKEIKVSPGEKILIKARLAASTQFQSEGKMRLNYSINGMKGQETVLLCPVKNLGDEFPSAPDYILDRPEQYHSRVIGDPTLAHRGWQGKNDLSAKIFLANNGTVLKLKAEVLDDVHHADSDKSKLWNGDSVQFVLSVLDKQGMPRNFEFTLAQNKEGKAECVATRVPDGFSSEAVLLDAVLNTKRDGNCTTYEFTLPNSNIGLDAQTLTRGIRFNVLVNDNDGDGRDGWLYLAPGIGLGTWQLTHYPLIGRYL